VVSRILADVQAGRRSSRVEAKPPKPPAPVPPPPRRVPVSRTSASFTIPLTVTVSLGDQLRVLSAQAPLRAPAGDTGGDVPGDDEAVVEDYRDREGYVPSFLGNGKAFTVDLPEVERHADDVLAFKLDGKDETELRYEHYSVVMSRSRRMCFFSAVNIDGGQSKKSKRVGWKWDPRIPKAQQIMNECYGNPPKFSRGHMTRREDPGWGNAATAKRGNEDSMHVTNTTPQMQAFNAPIWLALEDYALDHTKEDEMKVSVFTGPYFADDDPTMYGVRIPRTFWKIIAFIHDDTGKLCATGYEMNQEQSLQPEEEFVFGAFTSPQLSVATQVPIRSIEAKSGLSFGRLASVDPLARATEALATDSPAPLVSLEQIRFLP
jgi:endonuclease G